MDDLRITNSGRALLLLSAPCWWLGAIAFFPVVGAVYDAPDSATQIKIVSSHPTAWLAQNLCFLAGLLAASAGLVALTPMLRATRGWRFAQLGFLANVAATVAGVGVVYLYVTSSVRQTSESPPMYSGAGANPLHMPFAVLTLVAFICYGFALVRVRGLRTAGIVAIALSIVMLTQVTRQHDAFPPLFFYTVPSILGIRLLFRRLPGSQIHRASSIPAWTATREGRSTSTKARSFDAGAFKALVKAAVAQNGPPAKKR